MGEKRLGDHTFTIYVSCKNWNEQVKVKVVREEVGKIMQLTPIPHVKVLVASYLTKSAKDEALANGFIVVETGGKATEENAFQIYKDVYRYLSSVFGVVPTRIQIIAEQLKKLSEELTTMLMHS